MLLCAAYDILKNASSVVRAKFPYLKFFSAHWVFIVTWYNVTFYGCSTRPCPVWLHAFGSFVFYACTV